MSDLDANSPVGASLSVEHTVPHGEGLAFRWWHAKLTRTAKRVKGYVRTEFVLAR